MQMWIQKVPFVCFYCRQSWKTKLPFYWQEYPDLLFQRELHPVYQRHKCHGSSLAFLGRYFKTPRKSDLKQWRKAQMLYKARWCADGYSAGPKTLADAREYLRYLPAEITKEKARLESRDFRHSSPQECISRAQRKRPVQSSKAKS
ncbi:hypothetical protein B1R32_1123 [Abditibacterium utsteinense]|uniref:Uncharacterized protein n=1 Tax=Abditibacterium utsteinense TaxID=1960156 RepID=A0A2S8SRE5_9BACT|nr:hypothetical protein [Abditibacterium utsteinense]PQV63348.1 hypothetical protein B1R32_1123 [Abditibacterium utsteinense]